MPDWPLCFLEINPPVEVSALRGMWRACRYPACAAVVLVLALAAGCGPRAPYACVRVSGKVTYDDGSLIPAEQIRVTFVPQAPPINATVQPHSGSAAVDVKSGKFAAATTYSLNGGIIAGKHKVLVYAYSGGKLRTDLVPNEYSDPGTTPLLVDTSQLPFDIKVRKPK